MTLLFFILEASGLNGLKYCQVVYQFSLMHNLNGGLS